MPDLWLDVDAALSEVPVNILPLIDDSDFKSIEGAVAYDAAGMALRWHFVTCAGAYTVTTVTPTTSGNYDWTDQGDSGIYTIEIPASGGASINNDTEGFGWFTGVATGVLPWRGPTIGFRRAALNDLMIEGSTASTNLEDFFDGTGYVGGTIRQHANVDTIKTNPVVNAGTITFPTDATVASTTNITAGTITTTTNVTTVNGLAANVITATAIANAAIDAATFAAGAIDATAIADGAIDAATFAANAITSTVIADNAITANKIASDAITDAKVASDVTIASVTGAVGSVTGAVGSVTGGVGGNVTGSVGSVAAGGITAASIADGALDALTFTATIGTGTVGTGSTTTSIVLSAVVPASAVNDQFNGRIIIFDRATTTTNLRGQATDITDYDHASTTMTVTALTTAPVSGDSFHIL